MKSALFIVLLCGILPACARPILLHREWVLSEVSSHYRAFYPASGDPDAERDVGLLRPRFGLPAIVQAGAPFEIEVLQRGAAAAQDVVSAALVPPDLPLDAIPGCVARGPEAGCYPLELSVAPAGAPAADMNLDLALGPGVGQDGVGPVTGSIAVARLVAHSRATPPAGGYDLYLSSKVDAPTRAPRAVWLRADDPAQLAHVRVAHLSDLHVGKGNPVELLAHIRRVIEGVNALGPDLVVVTGDLVNRGQDPRLPGQARALLQQLHAPVLVVLGNHDIEFRASLLPVRYRLGWSNFARVFHPYLHFSLTLGGYDFVGFDSGPGTRWPRILTRGLLPASVDELRADLSTSFAAGHRGVVLFSHAPSRATMVARAHGKSPGRGFFGHMNQGTAAFEGMLFDAAGRGQRVLHLAGHTHWSDIFESQDGEARRFRRWPLSALTPCLRPITGKVALITTQAASHSGLIFKKNARGYGFSFLVLGDGDPQVAVHRYGTRLRETCPFTS